MSSMSLRIMTTAMTFNKDTFSSMMGDYLESSLLKSFVIAKNSINVLYIQNNI